MGGCEYVNKVSAKVSTSEEAQLEYVRHVEVCTSVSAEEKEN
jgi:hypothetical protein